MDTAGFHDSDPAWQQQMDRLSVMKTQLQPFLVLPVTHQWRVLEMITKQYATFPLKGCVLTKLDETASLGEALSVVIQSQLPVVYTTHGQNIPEDIRCAVGGDLVKTAATSMNELVSDDVMARQFVQGHKSQNNSKPSGGTHTAVA